MAPIAERREPHGQDDAAPVRCAHAPPCGGCPLIDAAYPEQLTRKHDRLSRALRAYAETRGAEVDAVAAASPIVDYRPRAKLVVSSSPVRIGLYAQGTHDVVDIPECRVLSPTLRDVAASLRALVRDAPELLGGALLAVDLREARHVDDDGRPFDASQAEARDPVLRSARQERTPVPPSVLVTLVLDRARPLDPRTTHAAAEALLAASPHVAGVAASLRAASSPQLLGTDLRILAGPPLLAERGPPDEPMTFARHGSFVQAHPVQAVALRAHVAMHVVASSARSVLELYGGSGTLALSLARRGLDVTMVESFAPAAEDARHAARAQSLRLDVRASGASAALRRLTEQHARFDAVVLDPPRRGLTPDVRAAIPRLHPRLVVYVSCHPRTLARDLADLAHRGYRADRVEAFDMMPLTEEVEAVVALRPAPPPDLSILHEDDHLLVVEKPPHVPAASSDPAIPALLARVRARAGWSAAELVLPLDDDASGAVLLARDRLHADVAAAALDASDAHTELVALVRGIAREKGTIRRPVRARRMPGAHGVDPVARYRRTHVALGHSVVRLTAPPVGDDDVARHHLAGIGHPVLGDARFGDPASNRHFFERHGLDRSFLHRRRIDVPHPDGGRLVV
ncbi:MAG: RsmD family RNA methyltransferase, partial [Deltaproteobacteria bacterium]|nr:RsmD family RNA methyltransferase [Deltaproteobacteria bacterium]